MKTIVNILTILILSAGFTCQGLAQGIENDGGYIKGSSTSYVKFSGSSDMTLKSTTADRTTLGNVTVDFTGTGSYKLTIPDDSYVTVDGNLTLNDSLYLKASSSGMASLITNGSVSGSYAMVEQYLSEDQWHLVSSPVSSAKSKVYTSIYLRSFSESDSTWSWITTLNVPLNVTQGYAVWASSALTGNATVRFHGTLNTGNQAATVTYNSGLGKGDGWNLVGNPFPSALEWNSSWTKSNIDATVYVYDGSQYLTWNHNLGGYGTKADGSIPSTQGFWVKANAASPSLTIPNGERIHSSQAFYKNAEASASLLNIKVTGNGYADNTLIGCYSGATDLFDSDYDAYKLKGINAAPQLYSIMHHDELSVNILAEIAGDNNHKAIPLGFEVGDPGQYNLSFEGLDEFLPGMSIYLEDRSSAGIGSTGNKLINVRQTPYYTVFAKPQDNPERFILHINMKTGQQNETPFSDLTDQTLIYSANKQVYVYASGDGKAQVTVFDILGKEITTLTIPCNELHSFDLQSPTGYYIIHVMTAGGLKSEKVFIQ